MVSWVESRTVFRTEAQHSCGCPGLGLIPTFINFEEFTHMKIAISMVIPSADRVDEPRVIELTEAFCQFFFRRTISLTPCFIVDDLLRLVSRPRLTKDFISYPSRD